MYGVKETARKITCATESDDMNVKRIVRYLKGAPSAKCLIETVTLPKFVNVFTDSDWAGHPMTSKSTSCGVLPTHSRMHPAFSQVTFPHNLASHGARRPQSIHVLSWSPIVFAVCFDLATSNGLLLSMPGVLPRVLQPIPTPLQQLRRHYLKMLARKWRAEAFRNALRYHGTFSKSNCLLMSLPTLSCGPIISRPAERALGWWTRFAEISAAVPGLEVSL